MTVYVMRINAEPDEEPLRLSQEDFDLLMDMGSREQPSAHESDLVDFATVETEPSADPFTWHDQPVDEDVAAVTLGRGLGYVIRSALEHLREQAALPADENPATSDG